MKGATTAAAGTAGLVPAPSKGSNLTFLRGDGTWADPVLTGVGNVRYNESTDMVQIYDGTTWVDWKSGGLAWDGSLYREGNTYSDITGGFSLYQLAGYGGGSYTLTFNTNNIKIDSTSSLGILSTNNTINFSEFSKLHIEGTLNQTGGDSIEFTVGFGTSKNTTTTSVYSLKGITGTKVISETIDISTHNANSLYIHIKFYATYDYKWNGNFILTNLYFLP